MSPQVMVRGETAQKRQILATPQAIKTATQRYLWRLSFNDLEYEENIFGTSRAVRHRVSFLFF
jgi:hypothetical protein